MATAQVISYALARRRSTRRARAALQVLLAGLACASVVACGATGYPPRDAGAVHEAAANATYNGFGTETYAFDARAVTLIGGTSEQSVAGSLAKRVTTLTAMQASGSLNGAGHSDSAVVLTQVQGQSGTASYVAALLSGSTGQLESTATNAQLIGSKVEVTKVTIGGGIITVDFLDHKAGESMDSRPTHSLSKRFGVAEGKLNVAP